MDKRKQIVSCYDGDNFCILVPVYYECEDMPSWRKVFVGTKTECTKEFAIYPDFLIATDEENMQNRKNKRQEYLFLLSINKKAQAEKIKVQYNF